MGDPLIWILILPGMILGGVAQSWVKSAVMKYSRLPLRQGLTGAEVARYILDAKGLRDVGIEPSKGILSDHYDPRDKTLRLSEPVYNARSISAIGVACHEAGHALQHATGYKFLQMRSKLVPVTNISSKMSMPVLMAGMFMMAVAPALGMPVMLLGVALFAAAVVFSIVTLPVEWDASARAKTAMVNAGIVSSEEVVGAGRVLNAAFLTYLASAIASIMTLIYYLHRTGILRMLLNRR